MKMIYFRRVTSESLNLICIKDTRGCFIVMQYYVFFALWALHLVAGSHS